MGARKMHADEVDVDVPLVRELVGGQFPHLADLPVRAVRSTATVNAIFRLGDGLCVRLPRVGEWARGLDREWEWLPKLAPHLPLRIPTPIEKGRPDGSYPFSWAIYQWIEGRTYSDELVDDERQAARDLARFVAGMRRMGVPAGAPRGGRKPLRELDGITRAAIDASRDLVEGDPAIAAWERALKAPTWNGSPVWIHADLLRPNLLVKDGRLHAVIDFGGVGVGDPAADVIAAWSVFGPTGRTAFREALGVDDGTWNRARGFALHQAALIIPYYTGTNPDFVSLARRTVEQVLFDLYA